MMAAASRRTTSQVISRPMAGREAARHRGHNLLGLSVSEIPVSVHAIVLF
jgi:hypothetical protein